MGLLGIHAIPHSGPRDWRDGVSVLVILILDTTLNSQAEADVHALKLLRPHMCRHPGLSLKTSAVTDQPRHSEPG